MEAGNPGENWQGAVGALKWGLSKRPMNQERWRRVDRLYHEALARPADAREAFLREACTNDEDVLGEVLSLLAQPDGSWTSPLTQAAVGPRPADTPALVGRRLGVYHVQALIGAGGMGEVYRARDTRLGRDVAVKILPREWMADAQRRERLEREARALASLNHSNIATIHGIEEHDGIRALVLELVEGDTLADRIVAGPIALPEAVAIARQIANALDAAHEKGIVHRDLKPANIKITPAGVVKVLDFGLAKLDPAAPRGESPTLTLDRTHAGVIAGTVPYMSPEQARGLEVDRRTDVWAFGCVLFEMLSGRSAFGRGTPTDTLAAVIHGEPDWQALPPRTPPAVRRLLQRCLEKDVRRRLRDIGDVDLDLTEAPAATPRSPRWMMAMVAAALVIAAGAALMIEGFPSRSTPVASPVSLNLLPPEGQRFVLTPVPSPDGSRIAFVATAENEQSALWMRVLSETTPRRLAGTEGAVRPFWSPDSRFIGFAADGRLKKIDVNTGTLQTICICVTELLGGTWGTNGLIVFAPFNRLPLHRVAAAGGTSEPLTELDPGRNENSHRWPHFLPGGRHVLYTARSDVTKNTGVYVMDLETGTRQWLLEAQSQAIYVSSGHLLFVRDGALLAQAFDVRKTQLSGEPSGVVGGIDHNTTGAQGLFAASYEGGVLAYRGGFDQAAELVRFDRAGVRQGAVSEEAEWVDLELSPDGARVALVRVDSVSGNRDIWLLELITGRLTKWSAHPATDWHPIWSPDSRHLMFASDRNGASAVFRRAVDGSGEDRLVMPGFAAGRFPTDWSVDDRLVVSQDQTTGSTEIWIASAAGGEEPRLLKRAGRTSGGGRVSPDGRWLAYVSDESDSLEVYASPIDGSSKHRISTAGGIQPRWHKGGRELLYLAPDNALMSVAVEPGASFKASPPERLFASCLTSQPPYYSGRFDVADDGTTFWLCPGGRAASGVVTVSVGWSPDRSSPTK